MMVRQGRPVCVRLDTAPLYVWWGEDAEDELSDAVAVQDSKVLTFRSFREAKDFARSRGWDEAPEENLSVVDISAAKESLHGISRVDRFDAWLTSINFADDIEHSLGATKGRLGQALAVYQRLVEANVPYLLSDSNATRARWSRHDFNVISDMVRRSIKVVETSLDHRH